MLGIKGSFLKAKYSLTQFLKITTMHGLSEWLRKEDFLLCDQETLTERACLLNRSAVSSSCGVYYKRWGFSAYVFEQERRWCW